MTTFQRPGTPFPHTEAISYYSNSNMASSSMTPPMPSSPNTSAIRAWQYALSSRPLHFTLPALSSPTPPSLLLKRQSSSGSTHIARTHQVQSAPAPSASASATTSTASPLIAPTPRRPSTTSTFSDFESSSACSSCSSSLSGGMPITPRTTAQEIMHIEDIKEVNQVEEDEAALHLDLESDAETFDNFKLPSAAYFNFPDEETGRKSRSTEIKPILSRGQAFFPSSHVFTSPMQLETEPEQESPKRPKLKRRDTPRPTSSSVSLFSPVYKQSSCTEAQMAPPATATASSSAGSASVFSTISQAVRRKPKRQLTSVIDGGNWLVVA